MTVTDQIKTLDNKIEANQTQYDLGRATAKILRCHITIFWISINI